MQIVIDISEEDFELYKDDEWNIPKGLRDALENATPLPKGHGRLIDADRLYDEFEYADYDFDEALEYAPTIIEADEEAESENRK